MRNWWQEELWHNEERAGVSARILVDVIASIYLEGK